MKKKKNQRERERESKLTYIADFKSVQIKIVLDNLPKQFLAWKNIFKKLKD